MAFNQADMDELIDLGIIKAIEAATKEAESLEWDTVDIDTDMNANEYIILFMDANNYCLREIVLNESGETLSTKEEDDIS